MYSIQGRLDVLLALWIDWLKHFISYDVYCGECSPLQALLHSSHMFSEAKNNFAHHGVIAGDLRIDVDGMMKQKSEAVSGLTKGIEGLFKKYKVDPVH